MSSTKEYSSEDVDPVSLLTEIEAATFGGDVSGIRTDELSVGGNRCVKVITGTALTTGEQTELDGIIAAHTP